LTAIKKHLGSMFKVQSSRFTPTSYLVLPSTKQPLLPTATATATATANSKFHQPSTNSNSKAKAKLFIAN
jgi:hypothetical protein